MCVQIAHAADDAHVWADVLVARAGHSIAQTVESGTMDGTGVVGRTAQLCGDSVRSTGQWPIRIGRGHVAVCRSIVSRRRTLCGRTHTQISITCRRAPVVTVASRPRIDFIWIITKVEQC
jgi:hypothetical protein